MFWKQLKESLERHGNPIKVLPRLDGRQIDMFTLYRLVVRFGGHTKVTAAAKWSDHPLPTNPPPTASMSAASAPHCSATNDASALAHRSHRTVAPARHLLSSSDPIPAAEC